MPKTVILNHDEGVYAIDSYDKGGDSDKNILTWMVCLALFSRFASFDASQFAGHTPRKIYDNDA